MAFNKPRMLLRTHSSWLQVWDLGGQEKLRASWVAYYANTNAVILVVDSTDRNRISLVKDELTKLLGNEELSNAVVLVFANKQDMKNAMSAAEISDALALHTVKSHNCHIQACCAITGDGLMEGLEWISQNLKIKDQLAAQVAP